MATNFDSEGIRISLPTASGAESGDPMVLGNHTPCVLLTDADDDSPYYATVQTEGVFRLSVKGYDGSSNMPIDVFGPVYYNSGADPVLNADDSGLFFGVAFDAVDTGTTGTIRVKLQGCCIVPEEQS